MKYIGFLKEFDPRFPFSRKLEGMKTGNDLSKIELEKTIEYLRSAKSICEFMEYWFDENNQPIGPALYYSDGEWCWPEYYIHYISKYKNFQINQDFLEHCKLNNFICHQIDEAESNTLSREFLSFPLQQ